MSVTYNGEHQICFWKVTRSGIENPKFSRDDLNLIPQSRPYISVPKANYSIVCIPHSSGRINITDSLPGGMTYESRAGTWEFNVDHNAFANWTKSYDSYAEYFHGSRMYVSLNDDPTKIFVGRIKISSYESGENYSAITLSYDLDAMPAEGVSLPFRIRFFGSDGRVIKNEIHYSGDLPYCSPPVNHTSSDAAFAGWKPTVTAVEGNMDYHPVYYFKAKKFGQHSAKQTFSASPEFSLFSSHPIIYVIEEEPEEVTEETYEIPDNVKFLFNKVNYSIDVLGSRGSTIKKLYYTPENMEIETDT